MLMMRDMEEMTEPEVAAALALTVEPVKNWLSRG
jgi:DNA-directed RNA polymerase specialized sigma24 family protein